MIVILLAGGGHGYFEPVIFLYPLTAISFFFFENQELGFGILALIQFPLYGFLIDKLGPRMTTKIITVLILVFHFSLAFFFWFFLPEGFL